MEKGPGEVLIWIFQSRQVLACRQVARSYEATFYALDQKPLNKKLEVVDSEYQGTG